MQHLIVVAYDNPTRARATLDALRDLSSAWLIVISDALAVIRADDGQLQVQARYRTTVDEHAGLGVVLGGLLGGLALAPLTGGLSAAAATAGAVGAVGGATLGGVVGHADGAISAEEAGLPDAFVHEVAAALPPGCSALFVMAESLDPAQIAEHFRGTGGTILRTTFPLHTQDQIQDVISDRPTLAAP